MSWFQKTRNHNIVHWQSIKNKFAAILCLSTSCLYLIIKILVTLWPTQPKTKMKKTPKIRLITIKFTISGRVIVYVFLWDFKRIIGVWCIVQNSKKPMSFWKCDLFSSRVIALSLQGAFNQIRKWKFCD